MGGKKQMSFETILSTIFIVLIISSVLIAFCYLIYFFVNSIIESKEERKRNRKWEDFMYEMFLQGRGKR